MTELLGAKQLELLRELVPTAATIGLLANPSNPAAEARSKELEAAAQALGREIHVVNASNASELGLAFTKLVDLRVSAFLIVGDAIMLSLRRQIVELAARCGLPAIYSRREFTEAGGLMSYGGSLTDIYRLIGVYAGRILKGEKPADLPVQQSTKVELIINLKTAKALAATLLARADEVIE